MESFEQWNTSAARQTAQALFPNETDPGALWHADYFRREPKTFMLSVKGHYDTLMDAAQQQQYLTAIRSFLDRNFEPGKIQEQIVANRWPGEWFLSLVYPDWFEWYQSWRVMFDLEQWLKDTITFQRESIGDAVTRENYIKEVNRLLETYGPDNWAERVSEETALEWIPIFKKQELEVQAAAAAALKDIKTQKLIGALFLGGFGLWGVSYLMSRKKRV